jgi:hypothetical protein
MVVAFAQDHILLLGAPGRNVLRGATVHPGEHQVYIEADVARVVREHVLDGGPGVAVPFHSAPYGVLPQHGPARQGVLDRKDQLLPFKGPQLDLYSG